MMSILMMAFYYIVLPFFLASLVLKLLRKYGAKMDPAIAELAAKSPIQKKFFRAVRRDEKGLSIIGDFETQPETVEAVYRERAAAVAAGRKASFLVLNDKSETFEQIDS